MPVPDVLLRVIQSCCSPSYCTDSVHGPSAETDTNIDPADSFTSVFVSETDPSPLSSVHENNRPRDRDSRSGICILPDLILYCNVT